MCRKQYRKQSHQRNETKFGWPGLRLLIRAELKDPWDFQLHAHSGVSHFELGSATCKPASPDEWAFPVWNSRILSFWGNNIHLINQSVSQKCCEEQRVNKHKHPPSSLSHRSPLREPLIPAYSLEPKHFPSWTSVSSRERHWSRHMTGALPQLLLQLCCPKGSPLWPQMIG